MKLTSSNWLIFFKYSWMCKVLRKSPTQNISLIFEYLIISIYFRHDKCYMIQNVFLIWCWSVPITMIEVCAWSTIPNSYLLLSSPELKLLMEDEFVPIFDLILLSTFISKLWMEDGAILNTDLIWLSSVVPNIEPIFVDLFFWLKWFGIFFFVLVVFLHK